MFVQMNWIFRESPNFLINKLIGKKNGRIYKHFDAFSKFKVPLIDYQPTRNSIKSFESKIFHKPIAATS